MKLVFDTLKLHNFLSFGDATIQLNNRNGFTLIRGVNNNTNDLAKSNGSGKSSIWSAITYALVGETIQGLKSNIVNIYTTGGCYVDLLFYVDSVKYQVIRYKEYEKIGTDLKIFIDDKDVSGKGIRESQAILNKYLPDLTADLIGSVIIIGQGMPHKFSSYTSANRKELLENLSKSNFMIEDLKNRVNKRKDTLNKDIREVEDKILQVSSNINYVQNTKSYTEQVLAKLQSTSYTQQKEQLENDKKSLEELTNLQSKTNQSILKNNDSIDALQQELSDENHKYLKETESRNHSYYEEKKEIEQELFNINAELTALKSEFKKLSSITDVCPTCHQKIVGVVLPDLEPIKESIKSRESVYNAQNLLLQQHKEEYDKSMQELTETHHNKEKILSDDIQRLKDEKKKKETEMFNLETEISSLQKTILDMSKQVETYETQLELYTTQIENYNREIEELNKEKLYNNNVRDNLISHRDVVDKMMTLLKRDFRGYLLGNVINYINQKMKEYSLVLFNTDNIGMELDGNDIDISFCGKSFENLSGGEKQKIDLIIQFSIRDMLTYSLNFSSNILVLDEIFDNLDSVGTNSVVELISSKLQDVENIYIISHHADELLIPYDYEITIEKNLNGISEVV